MNFDYYSIRPILEQDAQLFFHLIDENRKRLEDFFAGLVAKNKSLQDTLVYMPSVTERAANKSYFSYFIIDNNTQKPVGLLDIKNIDWSVPKAELGCFMDAAYAGKGIAAQALALFVRHCFQHYQFHKVFLRTHETNIASRRIVEKNGFIVEGNIRSDYKTTDGRLIDLMYYGLLSTDI